MREFPAERAGEPAARRGELGAADIDALAARVAAFHGGIDVAAADGAFGAPTKSCGFAQETLRSSLRCWPRTRSASELESFVAWTEASTPRAAALSCVVARRLRARMPRRSPSRQHRAHRRRARHLRRHRVQRRDALDRRDERSRLHRDGSRGARSRRPGAPLSQRVSRAHRRLRGPRGAAVLSRVPRARARKIARLRATQARRRRSGMRRSRSRAATFARAHLRDRSAAGIDHHPRPLGLRQDGGIAGAARAIGAVRVRSDVERKRLHGSPPTRAMRRRYRRTDCMRRR